MDTKDLLARLIAFDTTSRNSNLELISFVQDLLDKAGAEVFLLHNEERTKANLFATIGPRDIPGIMLSGHTDVVPVDGQVWIHPAFELTQTDGRLYGRGTCDMKGFIASAVCTALRASQYDLKTPLHLALSFDEEIGCIGVRSLIDSLAAAPVTPLMCIVGEPTSMSIATGHKGKIAARAICHGKEAHSALAPTGLNAIHLAADFVQLLKSEQERILTSGVEDTDYDVAYSSIHVGTISGGTALNIVPNTCTLDFEVRNIAEDNAEKIMERINKGANAIAETYRSQADEAAIELVTRFTYPGLKTEKDSKIVEFVKSLTGGNSLCKVAFGTEGGLFSGRLGIPTVVCGPGDMAQGHKPDEFISVEQLELCDRALARLLEHLKSGVEF